MIKFMFALLLGVAPIAWAQQDDEILLDNSTAAQRASGQPPRTPLATNATKPAVGDDPWEAAPGKYTKYIGFESTGSTSILGRDMIVYGTWKKDRATEFFLGFSKSSDTWGTTDTNTNTSSSSTSVHSVTGVKNPFQITVGAGQNFRLSRAKWINVYVGYFGGLSYTTSSNYETGTTTTSTPNTASPDDFTVTKTSVGSVSVKSDPTLIAGGKLGAEFYLRWFPNLGLGFSTGIVTGFGGGSSSSTTTESGVDTYTGGVKTGSTVTSSNTNAKTDSSLAANTFGVGGTTFQLTGLFTIRYLW